MKSKYNKVRTEEKEIEIEIKNIKDCYFEFYNWYRCYFSIHKIGESKNRFWNIDLFIIMTIKNESIFFEKCKSWNNFIFETAIKNFFENNENIKEISKSDFLDIKHNIFN